MAKGKTHDKINICTLVILIWAAYFYFNFRNPLLLLVFSLSYIFGTLYLSPTWIWKILFLIKDGEGSDLSGIYTVK